PHVYIIRSSRLSPGRPDYDLMLSPDWKPPIPHQRLDRGVAAAELAIGGGGVDRVPRREQQADELFGEGLVVKAAWRLGEGFGGVGGQDVGPHIAVIAGGVALAGKDVGEMRASVP